MPDFPSPEQIVEDLNDLNPFIREAGPNPRQGEVDAANYIADLSRRYELGDTKLVELPKTHRYADYTRHDPQLANVVIEAGTGTEELLIYHGHFDVVPPTDYRGNPHKIVRGDNPHILKRLGGYDMLSGIAAILHAMRNLQINARRRVRAILVCGEENDSEGTHAAFDRENDLFAFHGQRIALSTEITVGATIKDPLHLVVGRPGRYSYELMMEGQMKHSGEGREEDVPLRTLQRLAAIDTELAKLKFPPHPRDTQGILHPGQCAIQRAHLEDPRSLSTPGYGHALYNVHYADPGLTAAAIQDMMNDAARKALGDDNFIFEKVVRNVPWLPPWLEEVGKRSYAHKIQHLAGQVVLKEGIQSQTPTFRTGSGVADENIISNHDIPVVCVPPKGEHPHKASEQVDMRGTKRYQIPVLRAAAAYDRPLAPKA